MRSIAFGGERARSAAWLMPAVAFLLYAATAPGLARGHAAGVYATAAALVERRGGEIDGWLAALAPLAGGADRTTGTFGPVAYAGGHYYYAAPPGPALVAAPAYALGNLISPFAGQLAPALLVALLGPLAGALGVAGVARLFPRDPDGWRGGPLAGVAAVAAFWPLSGELSAPVLVALLGVWLWPVLLAAWRARHVSTGAVLTLGLGLGAFALLDYAAGLVALLLALTVLWAWRRDPRAAAILAVAMAAPLVVLALYQTAAFGRPWGLAFRLAVDPATRSWARLFSPVVLALALAPLLHLVLRQPRGKWARSRGLASPMAIVVAGVVAVALRGHAATLVPFDWRDPAATIAVAIVAALLGVLAWGWQRAARPGSRPLLAALCLLAVVTLAPPVTRAGASLQATPEQYLAPFAIQAADGPRLLWSARPSARAAPGGALRLDAGASATSPWIDVTPGVAYALAASADAPMSVVYRWEDTARQPLVQHAAAWGAGRGQASFAAPVMAAGLRIEFVAGAVPVQVSGAAVTVAAGVRVEPFPNYARAALAFSYDWESAMGGLIHTRSGPSAGEGPGGALAADGAPSVADAEARGILMRDGARYLAAIFKRYDLRATFYATGYDLLDGNPSCEKFVGDPTYKAADLANGWGSDYWRTHPWYSFDPCSTESAAPAWYFASETRELAAQGHEIGSHTFGHLYVRGVTPAQLAADLDQWLRSARALGLPGATTFAFPWTSSNSLDGPFWTVFQRAGVTVLTRLYHPLAHPFELDRVPDAPALAIFPDRYLPSTPGAAGAALGGIDETLARRGYFSLWAHPDEVMRQEGPRIWAETIAYAADKRASGLWVAPVGQIAGYGLATRDLRVTALPVAGGALVTIVNGSATQLDGVTLGFPAPVARAVLDGRDLADRRGSQVQLPPLAPGASVTVLLGR